MNSSAVLNSAAAEFDRKNYRGAIALARTLPVSFESRFMTAVSYFEIGEYREAAQAFAEAESRIGSRNPENFFYYRGLNNRMLGRPLEAAGDFLRVLQCNPNHESAADRAFELFAKYGHAEKALQIAHDFSVSPLKRMDLLSNVLCHAEALQTAVAGGKNGQIPSSALLCALYQDFISDAELFSMHRSAAENLPKEIPLPPHAPHEKIRIGLVSADFRRHSVAFFALPLIAKLDRSRFDVYLYSTSFLKDGITEAFQKCGVFWRDCAGLDTGLIAETARKDQLDVSVDLGGHTGRNPEIFARRIAPVQISWLGYPATTAVPAMDFRITCDLADPVTEDAFYTEKLLRMRTLFLTFAAPADAPEVAEAPCLKNGYLTFGQFNAPAKYSAASFDFWSGFLRTIPDSRFVFKNKMGRDPLFMRNALAEFQKRGIPSGRIRFLDYAGTLNEHLSSYSELDLALDTFPYNGTTTTCEALWMGVPTLSLFRNCHRSRCGLALMSAAGLTKFASDRPENLWKTAYWFSCNPFRLNELRRNLREVVRRSPLCAQSVFAREWEELLLRINIPQKLFVSKSSIF